MGLTPENIYNKYINGFVDKYSAFEQLSSLIENSLDSSSRIMGIKAIERLELSQEITYKFIENLFVSDSNEAVRVAAAEILLKKYEEMSYEPMRWALDHETSKQCLSIIFEFLLRWLTKLKSLINPTRKIIDEIKKISKKDFPYDPETLLQLSYNELHDILRDYFTITYLKKTYWRIKYSIKHNRIVEISFIFKELTKFPESIKYLSSLKKLSLKYNLIKIIPNWIGTLSKLEELDLSQNNLQILSDSLFSLRSLKSLNLEGNDLISIPKSIQSLDTLLYLNLKSNPIFYIPETLSMIKSLKELHVGPYLIVKIPQEIINRQNDGLIIFYESV